MSAPAIGRNSPTPHPTADPPNTPSRVRLAQRSDLDHCTLAHADLTFTKIHRKTSILRGPCHSRAAWRGQEPTTSQYAALLLTFASIRTPILAVSCARRHGTASSLDKAHILAPSLDVRLFFLIIGEVRDTATREAPPMSILRSR